MFENQKQIRIPKAAEVAAATIRKAIVKGQLKDGDSLPSEAHLIAQFAISRPTVREAMRILESEGLIAVSRGARGGARVSRPTPQIVATAMGLALQTQSATIADVYAARQVIEPEAARLAAETRPSAAAAALRRHLQIIDAEVTKGQDTHTAAVAAFHRVLVEESGNKTLALVAIALHGVLERHASIVHRNRMQDPLVERLNRLRRGLKSYERLVKLIEQGAGLEAETHWRSHMESAAAVLLNGVAQTAVVDILD